MSLSRTPGEPSLEDRRRIATISTVAKKQIPIIEAHNAARSRAHTRARLSSSIGDASRLATIERLWEIRRGQQAARILAPAAEQHNRYIRHTFSGPVPIYTAAPQWEDKFAHDLSARLFKSSLFGCLTMYSVRPTLRSLGEDTLSFLETICRASDFNRPTNPLVSVPEFGDAASAGEQESGPSARRWKGLTMISKRYSPPGRPPVLLSSMTDVELLCMQLGMVSSSSPPTTYCALNSICVI